MSATSHLLISYSHFSITDVFSIRTLVHVVFPAFRVLLLLPLVAALASPRVVYNSVQPFPDVEDTEPTASTFLLPPEAGNHTSTGLAAIHGNGESSKYGTFHTNRSTLQSAPATRPATPAPSTGPDTKV